MSQGAIGQIDGPSHRLGQHPFMGHGQGVFIALQWRISLQAVEQRLQLRQQGAGGRLQLGQGLQARLGQAGCERDDQVHEGHYRMGTLGAP